jgi:hypothetical protein
MSAYGKFLWGASVPAGGYDFGTSLGVASVAADDFDTILELAAELEAQLQVLSGTFAVTCSEIGTITVTGPAGWTWVTATTDDDFSALLGLDESTDVVVSNVLTASNQHLRGWYPGTITRGRAVAKGIGIVSDGRWKPVHEGSRLFTMSGEQSACFPATGLKRRALTIRPLSHEECTDEDRGVTAFIDQCIASTFRWYPDRALGTVADPGTQDTDFWKCTFVGDPPDWREGGRNPDFFSVDMVLNRCPGAPGGAM